MHKTPSERLSWPDLLYHPFIADASPDWYNINCFVFLQSEMISTPERARLEFHHPYADSFLPSPALNKQPVRPATDVETKKTTEIPRVQSARQAKYEEV